MKKIKGIITEGEWNNSHIDIKTDGSPEGTEILINGEPCNWIISNINIDIDVSAGIIFTITTHQFGEDARALPSASIGENYG